MKKIVLVQLLITVSSIVNAQSMQFEFIGTIQTADEHTMFYKVGFDEVGDGKIVGKTTTDYYGEHNTVAKIEGTLQNGKLSFHEVGNVTTDVSSEDQNFCFITVENLPFDISDNKSIIKGVFKGVLLNGESCVNGDIYLVGADYFKARREKMIALMEKKKAKRSKKESKRALRNENNKEKDQNIELTQGDELPITWKGQEGVIVVWDNFMEDQDMINIFLNDSLIYKNIEIKEKRKELPFVCLTEVCNLKIVAVNEGQTPPNTVHAILKDKSQIHPIITVLKKYEFVTIVLNKE
jgi:hypothetical protein